jgi:8-oxo-dGTP pyrophosphatase MutT (NUDIX family)
MDITINDDNLDICEINTFNTKSRALLIDDDNNILIANYAGVIILPGGGIDENEYPLEAIIRELKEETGKDYSEDEMSYLFTICYYQKDYPTRNNILKNRLIKTHYFIGKFKGVEKLNQNLTDRELKDNFKLELVPFDELEEIIKNYKTNNPRNEFFNKELLTVLKYYQENKNKVLRK